MTEVILTGTGVPEDAEKFAADLRDGGYDGRVMVGEDLTTIIL